MSLKPHLTFLGNFRNRWGTNIFSLCISLFCFQISAQEANQFQNPLVESLIEEGLYSEAQLILNDLNNSNKGDREKMNGLITQVHYALFFQEFNKAEEYIDQLEKSILDNPSLVEENIETQHQLFKAQLQLYTSQFSALQQSIITIEQKQLSKYQRAFLSNILFKSFLDQQLFPKCEAYLGTIFQNIDSTSFQGIWSYLNLAFYYFSINELDTAQDLINRIYLDCSPKLVALYSSLILELKALIAMSNNETFNAENLLLKAIELNTKKNWKLELASNFGNLGFLLYDRGLPTEASNNFSKSISLYDEVGSWNKKSRLLYQLPESMLQDSTSLLEAYWIILDVYKVHDVDNSVDYANLLNAIATWEDDYNLVDSLYNVSLSILNSRIGKNTDQYFTTLTNYAVFLTISDKLDKARDLYLEAYDIAEVIYSDSHWNKIDLKFEIADYEAYMNNYSQASEWYHRGMEALIGLGEKKPFIGVEKSRLFQLNKKFLNHIDKYFSFVFEYLDPLTEMDLVKRTLFFLKGFDLNASMSHSPKDIAQQSQNFEDLLFLDSLNSLLTMAFIQSEEESDESLIPISKLEYEIDKLKRKIFNNTTIRTKARPLVLFENQASLDYFSYNYYDHNQGYFTDTIEYFVMINNSDTSMSLVSLSKEWEISPLVNIGSDGLPLYLNDYDARDELTKTLFLPIQDKVSNCSKLFIAPNRLLNRVSFDVIFNTNILAQDNEQIELEYCRTLTNCKNDIPLLENKSIVFFGGVNYHSQTVEENRIVQFPFISNTRKEVNAISNMLLNQGWKSKKFLGPYASESSLRDSLPNTEGAVLHIATHGYFEYFKNVNTTNNMTVGQRITNSLDHWTRSGLLLNNGGDAWNKSHTSDIFNDGIVSSREFLNMDLSDFHLVVLSSCNSAIGDVLLSSESPFGLQRALTLAGAKQVLTSLWEIPDLESSLFMQEFYANLAKLNDTSLALSKAKETFRQRGFNPLIWSGFVLIN